MDWEKVGQEYPHYKAILSYPNSITSSPWMRGQQTMTRMATAGYLRRGPDGYEVVNPELRPLGNRKRRKPYTKRAPVSKPVEAEPANSGPSDIDAIRNEQTLQVAEELHFCPRCGNNLATYIHAMLVARQVR